MGLAVFGGAGFLYDKVINPFLTTNEQRIDDLILLIKSRITFVVSTIFSYLKSFIIKQVREFILGSITGPRAQVPPEEKKAEATEEKKEEVPEEIVEITN